MDKNIIKLEKLGKKFHLILNKFANNEVSDKFKKTDDFKFISKTNNKINDDLINITELLNHLKHDIKDKNKTKTKLVINKYKNIVYEHISNFKDDVQTLINKLRNLTSLEKIGRKFNRNIRKNSNLLEKFGLDDIINPIKDIGNSIKDGVTSTVNSAVSGVKDGVTSAANSAIKGVEGSFNTVKDSITSTVNNVTNSVNDVVNKTVDFAKKVPEEAGKITDTISKKITEEFDSIKRFFESFIGTITNIFNQIIRQFENILMK